MRTKVALVVLSISLSVLSVGCGSSGNNSSDPSGPLRITTQSPLPSGRVSTAYSTTFSAAGGTPPYTWSASSLPPGLVMSTVGTLAGTPTAPWDGVPITVAVSDTAHQTATGSFAITIVPQLQITTTSLPNGSPGVAYSAMLQATGGFPPYTWSIPQGSLPSGLTLNASTGVISGTPTGTGTFNLSVQVSDIGNPVATRTANLSITITPAPARSAAVYAIQGPALQITSDGSLSLLPSSPEPGLKWSVSLSDSPLLPLIFAVVGASPNGDLGPPFMLESMLVNPDYSLTLYGTSNALPDNCQGLPSVDPTGSNVYVTSCVDSNGDPGILIYPADGSTPLLGTIAISGAPTTLLSRMTFTADRTMGFVASCPPNGTPSVLSYSRASNGMLTLSSTYNLPANSCAQGIMVSPVSNYLALWEPNAIVQIFDIADNGSLMPATQPFMVMQNPEGPQAALYDLTWDSSGSFLVAALNFAGTTPGGGLAVLTFSGNSLSQNAYPTGNGSERVIKAGSFFYAQVCFGGDCGGLQGFDLHNGQLSPLPGGQYPGGYAADMVVY